MSEDDLKVTRRLFLQHSATAGTAVAWYSIAMKTDALDTIADNLDLVQDSPEIIEVFLMQHFRKDERLPSRVALALKRYSKK